MNIDKILKCTQKNCNSSLDLQHDLNQIICNNCHITYKIIDGIYVLNSNQKSIKSNLIKNEYQNFKNEIQDMVNKKNIDLKNKVIVNYNSENINFLKNNKNAKLKIEINSSFEYLKINRSKNDGIIYIQSDDEYIPLQDYVSDFTISNNILDNSKIKIYQFDELSRVTNQNGYLMLQTNSQYNFKNLFNYFLLKNLADKNFFKNKFIFRTGIKKTTYLLSRLYQLNIYDKIINNLLNLYRIPISKVKQKIFQIKNKSYLSNNRVHLLRSLNWIKKSFLSTPDHGISRGFSLHNKNYIKSNQFGWQPSYPEVTGYLIPSLIESNEILKDQEIENIINQTSFWVLQISNNPEMCGGNIIETKTSSVFDIGQILKGLLAYYDSFKNEKFLKQSIKLGDYLLSIEKNNSGSWDSKYIPKSVENKSNDAHHIYITQGLYQLTEITRDKRYYDLAERVVKYTLKYQNNLGQFTNSDFVSSKESLTHNLGYVIEGLIDSYYFHNAEFKLKALEFFCSNLTKLVSDDGFIPGKISYDWKSTKKYSCLTGSAQIAISFIKLYKLNKNPDLLKKALKIFVYLKEKQNNYDENFGGGIGAIWGSWPIDGGYQKNQSISWSLKYFIDLCNIIYKNKYE